MDLCLHSSSMPDASLDAMITVCHRHAIGAIELRLAAWQGHGLTEHAPDVACRQVRERLNDAGIVLAGLGSTLHVPAKPDDLAAALDLAARCGAGFLRVFLAASDTMADRSVGPIEWSDRNATGVAVLIENHSAFARLVDLDAASGSDAPLLWDIGQSAQAGEIESTIPDAVIGRVAHVHLKNGAPGPLRWSPMSLVDGSTDIAAVLRRLRGAGYAGYLSLEVAPALLLRDLAWLEATL